MKISILAFSLIPSLVFAHGPTTNVTNITNETNVGNYQLGGDSGAIAGCDFSINYSGVQACVAVGYDERQMGEVTNGFAFGAAKRFKFSEDTTGIGSIKAQIDEGGGKRVVGGITIGF